jgi:peroxiredoxin Q/BCP
MAGAALRGCVVGAIGAGSAMLRRCLAIVVVLVGAIAAEAKMLAPGDAFPAWQLTDQKGAKVSSSDLAGKTYLVWFYPKAQTPGCTTEGLSLKDRYADFQTRKVEIFGVSFDRPAENAAFVEEQGFPFRLLSDTDRSLAVAVGAATSREQPVASRISYLVGPDGKVLKAYPKVDPPAHAREVLADLPPAAP